MNRGNLNFVLECEPLTIFMNPRAFKILSLFASLNEKWVVGGNRSCAAYRQYADASLYSESDRVKKSSSCHCSVSKVGLFIGSLCQHSSMMSYRVGGHPGGLCMRYPCSTWFRTSAFVMPEGKKEWNFIVVVAQKLEYAVDDFLILLTVNLVFNWA